MPGFGVVVVCRPGQDVTQLNTQLREWLSASNAQDEYELADTGRDWVRLDFVGAFKEGEPFPWAYLFLTGRLLCENYAMSRHPVGSHFMPK